MKTKTIVSLLSVFLLAGMALAPTGASDEQNVIGISEMDVSVGPSGSGSGTGLDSNHEARCGGLAPIEPCEDTVFLPLDVASIGLGASISPEFNGYLVITLSTPPDPNTYFIEVTCEILGAGLVSADCQVTGGIGLIAGQTMTMAVDFDPIAVGGYEVFVTVA